MNVLALDPGTEQSALLHWDGKDILLAVIEPNDAILKRLEEFPTDKPVKLVIEEIQSYGMAVGKETFLTVFWSGRFAQIFGFEDVEMMGRRAVKTHICGSARATDANIRAALIDRFGGTERAVGKKANPGPLAPLKSHTWAAFAISITWHDQNVKVHASRLPVNPAEIPPTDFSQADDYDGSEEVDASVDTEDITVDAGELEGW